MDYTTKDRVKEALHAGATETVDDGLLTKLVTAASRAFDRKCTGAVDAVDYFMLSTVASERLRAQADYNGAIMCYPHKPLITSVSSFSYQKNIVEQVYTVDPARIEVSGGQVIAYPTTDVVSLPSRCWATISYIGGLSGSTAGLPEDLQELVALLAVRFYREEESGLSDAIGVAELATLVYTKAWPVRVLEQMAPYIRRVGWRYVS